MQRAVRIAAATVGHRRWDMSERATTLPSKTVDGETALALAEARCLGTPWQDGGAAGSTSVPVAFTGHGAGEDDLSWGQQDIWGTMRRERSWLPIGFTRPVPAGTTVEDVAAELAFCMIRYPSMRTRLVFTVDGRPRQVVAAGGEVALEVVDAGPDADPAEVAVRVQQRYQESDHDHATDWPVRMAVVRQHGVPRYQVMVVCHLVVDGLGALVMLAEMAARDPAVAPAGIPVTALQPLDQAREQRTPAARQRSAAALRHWEALLRSTPADRFTGSTDPREPRYWELGCESAALHLAVGPVAARAGLEESTVLLTAFGMAMSKVTGISPLLVQLVVGNRFRPGLAGSVSPVTQTGVCVLDVAGVDFDEALARTWRAALAGYKHGYYDPTELAELVDRVARERAEPATMRCGFNDRRMLTRGVPPVDPTPAAVRAARAATTMRVEQRRDRPFEPCYLHLLQRPTAVRLVLCADTHFLGPADQEAVLLGMEATVVDAALRTWS
jgi:Condensation domain